MSHTHLMESRLKAEMVVKPSALWQHRDVRDVSLIVGINPHSHNLLLVHVALRIHIGILARTTVTGQRARTGDKQRSICR